MTFGLRPATPEDEPFLGRLITETITLDLGASAWPEALKNQVVPLQATMRRNAARVQFPIGESWIVILDGEDAGWLYTAPLETELRVVDLMILDRLRGKGAGTAALLHALDSAGGKPVRLHVNVTNHRAQALYERLGFRRVGGNEVQHLMEHPGNSAC